MVTKNFGNFRQKNLLDTDNVSEKKIDKPVEKIRVKVIENLKLITDFCVEIFI